METEVKMKIETKKNKNLSRTEKEVINNVRIREGGEGERKDFERDYEPDTEWFFVKDDGKIVSLGCLRPIKISYHGEKYDIFGICSIFSVEKGKGYGRILIKSMIDYMKKKRKSGLGFTGKTEFFRKVGLGTEKDFIRRFVYKNPKTGAEVIDNDGDGIYLEGKDKFISKVLSNKSIVYINILHW
jgi:hypothetical protein